MKLVLLTTLPQGWPYICFGHSVCCLKLKGNSDYCLCITEALTVPGQYTDDMVPESEENSQKFISTLLESLFILRKIPETAEVTLFTFIQVRV